MSRPPIVLFPANEGYEKNSFKANLALYGLITNIISIFQYFLEGMINERVTSAIGFCLLALIIGSVLGIFLSKKINEAEFKKIMLVLLVVMGFTTVIKAAG